jgi:hypothetical protein
MSEFQYAPFYINSSPLYFFETVLRIRDVLSRIQTLFHPGSEHFFIILAWSGNMPTTAPPLPGNLTPAPYFLEI